MNKEDFVINEVLSGKTADEADRFGYLQLMM